MRFERYECYKDSGLEWLGEIPCEWGVKRVKDVSLVRYSNVDKKSYDEQENILLCNYTDVYKNEFITNKINFMKATASKEEIKKFIIKKDDVLFTKDSESFDDNANPCLIREDFYNVVCGYHLAQMRANKKDVIGSYLFRLLQSIQYNYHFAVNSKGITRVGLGLSAVKNAKLFLPPLKTQTKIATYLDIKTKKIDKEIALLKQKIEKYRELKQTLINETVLRGLDRGVEFKDSGIEWIGEIPKGWEVKRGKNIFKFKKIINKNLKSKNVLSLTYSGVINKDYNQLNGLNPTTYETYQFVKKNNLIFKLIDLENIKTSRVGLVHEDGIMSSAYIRLEPSKTIFSKYFYYLYFYYYKINLFNNLGGGVRATLNYTGLLNILILIPPYKEQVKIANYLDEKTQKIDNITQIISKKIELLKEFRKTLINDVVTGRVKV